MRETLTRIAVAGAAALSVIALAVAPANAGQKPGHTNQGNHGTPSAACTAARAAVAADRAVVRADRKQLNKDRATLEADQASSSPNVPADQAA
ncbi:MAG TPA: hypothetical protein VN108_02675, partial [Marmoricola sp.]|nr:hypothetical protein [Marmoricola sp.]